MRRRLFLGVLLLAGAIVAPAAQRGGDNPREILDRAIDAFLLVA